ncbi:septum site-determining protein MinC [Symbiobacterium thermophilum]|uniref:Probable septum site-determining protein MinC n=1 Tax=Symbiobacterium thermophilum TaxID=2734 RepID=A0A953LG92_SYMTR|nr:septum site-determining protein MinC [Symbiobacterium thermophilum]MBY6275016.1 septum site-determining protein MinC [Symbiobacterium thermophilum]
MRQDIVIRGTTRTGLVLLLPDEGEFSAVLERLADRLANSGRFFAGGRVQVHVGNRRLSPEDREALEQTLQRSGMVLLSVKEGGDPLAEVQPPEAGAPPVPPPPSGNTLVVTKTVRSGQEIRHDGDVIILGDVNPGAVVVATGHIVVMGALRGVAHAGCTGNRTAIVAATKLRPTQLRIAEVIGRAPDGDAPQSYPEVARIRGDLIVVEASAEKRQVSALEAVGAKEDR